LSIIYLTIFSFLAALEFAITKCVNGADISTVCGETDAFIVEELEKREEKPTSLLEEKSNESPAHTNGAGVVQ
jgi:hypothetical protein